MVQAGPGGRVNNGCHFRCHETPVERSARLTSARLSQLLVSHGKGVLAWLFLFLLSARAALSILNLSNPSELIFIHISS